MCEAQSSAGTHVSGGGCVGSTVIIGPLLGQALPWILAQPLLGPRSVCFCLVLVSARRPPPLDCWLREDRDRVSCLLVSWCHSLSSCVAWA